MSQYNYQTRDNAPRILIMSVAVLFGFLLLIFFYYLWTEQFDESGNNTPPMLNSMDFKAIRRGKSQRGGFDNDDQPATPNISQPNNNSNEVPLNPNDEDYVPPGFKKKPGANPKKQVFNVSNNIYSYPEAEAVCKAFGAELASYNQLVQAYKKGANWCNYGWTKGQLGLFPIQKEFWLKQQEEDPERRNDCGKVGINGGYFDNPDMLFGVNCYGMKPSPRDHEKAKMEHKSAKEYELEQKIAKIKRNMDNISILPFNKSKWSNC